MSIPALDNYFARLPSEDMRADARVWKDAEGRAQGRYFNCTLTSVFQPVREIDTGRIAGYEAYARSYSDKNAGLSLWKLLDQAADDDESVELDRLCRMLHAINFYRQSGTQGADLHLSVHDRLLAAVSANHGLAFKRILEGLGLPSENVVLQLPPVKPAQGWLLNHVADNYRFNGFRYAVSAASASDALPLLDRVRPNAVKIDAREINDPQAVTSLLTRAPDYGARVIFKRVESERVLTVLQEIGQTTGMQIYAQGYLWDVPWHAIAEFEERESMVKEQAFAQKEYRATV